MIIHNFRFILALNCVNELLRNMHDYEITTMIPLTYTSTCIQYSYLEILVNGSCMAVTLSPLNTVFHYVRMLKELLRQSMHKLVCCCDDSAVITHPLHALFWWCVWWTGWRCKSKLGWREATLCQTGRGVSLLWGYTLQTLYYCDIKEQQAAWTP